MHVDDWIDECRACQPQNVLHAKWFFVLRRLPALEKSLFREFIDKYKLFCDYDGKRYRVGGCSRMGDVWLLESLTDERDGYDLRVDVDKCSNWSETP